MNIKRFEVNPLCVNCYVVSDETPKQEDGSVRKEAVIIDCGCSDEHEWNEIKTYITEESLEVKHLLNTHLHFDHIWGNTFVYRDLGLRPEACYEDLYIYDFGQTTLKVITTPGHSRGCICFYDEANGVLFSGDTLFCGSCGRTDLEGGSYQDIMRSLQKLVALPESTQVFCGHGPSTTIEREKRYNLYLR